MQRLASKYTIGEASFAECVDFNADEPAKLHLIPRGSGKGNHDCHEWGVIVSSRVTSKGLYYYKAILPTMAIL